MLVSVGLAAQFKQLNTDLKRVRGQVSHIKFPFSSGKKILYEADLCFTFSRIQPTSIGAIAVHSIVK